MIEAATTTKAGSLSSEPASCWRFLLGFALLYALFEAAYFQLPDDWLRERFYPLGLIKPCVALVGWLAPAEKVFAAGNHLYSGRADLEIVRGCDGAGALFLLVAAILAAPAAWREKALGVVGGFTLLYLLNLGRIAGLYFIVAYQPDWFLPAHTYFAPILVVLAGCLAFAGWLGWAAQRRSASGSIH